MRKIATGVLILIAAFSADTGSCFAQNDEPDAVPGVSEPAGVSVSGSEGMPDTEQVYAAFVKKGLRKGRNSKEYIGSLLGLGMHYNRANRFQDASKTLKQALAIIDGGAMKPSPTAERKPEKIIERQHPGGVVSAEVVRTPYPYEEMMQELLPQLISAELGANELTNAEVHIKRLLAVKGANEVSDKLALMSAYASYAELMRKRKRPKEAEMYQRKVDEINSSFKPL
jgi:hypothetical protein